MSEEDGAVTPNDTPMEAPAKSITYKRDGEDQEILMSFGLLNSLLKRIGTFANVDLIGVDPDVNDVILKELLCLRSHTGKVTTEVSDITDIDIDMDDVSSLLVWAKTHLVDFSYRQALKQAPLLKRSAAAKAQVLKLMPGLAGPQS